MFGHFNGAVVTLLLDQLHVAMLGRVKMMLLLVMAAFVQLLVRLVPAEEKERIEDRLRVGSGSSRCRGRCRIEDPVDGSQSGVWR